jgi:alpha-glucosidase
LKGDNETIVESPIHKLPVYVKAGAIIPMQKPAQHTKEKQEELILHIYNGAENTQFDFYEDDGATFDFENGSYSIRSLRFDPAGRKIVIGQLEGGYKSTLSRVRLILHGFEKATTLSNGGRLQSSTAINHSFFLPLEKYDPINDPDSMGEEEVIEWVGDLTDEKMEFNF